MVGLEEKKMIFEECKFLLERFNYLTALRISTSRRYGIVLGAIVAFITVTLNQEELSNVSFEDKAMLVFYMSVFMQMLGFGALSYDWKIRARAAHVAVEIRGLAEKIQLSSKENGNLDEDRWFAGEIFISNAFVSILLIGSLISQVINFKEFQTTPLFASLISVAFLVVFTYLYYRLWDCCSKRYARQVHSWLPE